MADLQKTHVQGVMSRIERSYFPSVMLHVTTQNPGARGEELEWRIFQQGVINGADASYEQLGTRLEAHVTVLAKTYQQLEVALELSDDMGQEALELLLAARNTLALHLQEEWTDFNNTIRDWAGSALGLRVEHLMNAEEDFDATAMGATFLLILVRGHFHPFWAWAVATYIRRQDVQLHELRGLCDEFLRVPPMDELNKLQKEIELANMARQYVAWAKIAYKELTTRIKIKSEGMVSPNNELVDWIGTELFHDTEGH